MYGEIGHKARSSLGVAPASAGSYPVKYSTGITGYSFVWPPIGTANTVTMVQSKLYCYPWFVPNDIVLLDVGIDIQTAVASSVLRLGVYYDNGNFFPGNLFQDFGINSSGTTINGNQTAANTYMLGGLTVPLLIPAGFYWMAIVSQGAQAKLFGQTTQITYNLTSNAQPGSQALNIAFAQTSVTGALPTPFAGTRAPTSDGMVRIIIKMR